MKRHFGKVARVNWVIAAACALIAAALGLRWRKLGGRRPPARFWIGLALVTPALSGFSLGASWHSVLAAWGLWLALDGLAAACGRPALLGSQADAAVWALVLSLFGWAGVEYLNEYFPVWTTLGLPFHPLAREAALGLLGAPVVPTVLTIASICSPDSSAPQPVSRPALWRLVGLAAIILAWSMPDLLGAVAGLLLNVCGIALVVSGRSPEQPWSLAGGAITWAAFDSLWSQLGPAQRLFVDYASPALLPWTLAVCALCLTPIYGAVAEFLDKPRFDPFERNP